MPEHQQIQQSKKPGSSSQRKKIPKNQNHVSSPASITQCVRIDPKSLTPADVLQLQRTIGNRAVGRLFSGVRNPSTIQQAPTQCKVIDEEEITEPNQLFQRLELISKSEWEIAAAKSLLADHVIYNLKSDSRDKIVETIQERINLAHAIISIANTGILPQKERRERNIHSQQSIDRPTGGESYVSLSQAEIGDNNVDYVAGLLEHQAMSVRMEKYLEKLQDVAGESQAVQVPEELLNSLLFKRGELSSAFEHIKTEDVSYANCSLNEFLKMCKESRLLFDLLYRTVIMIVREENEQTKSLLHHELAQRASLAAMFIGTPDSIKETNPTAYTEMSLDQKRPSSHELRTRQSIPGNSLKYVLVPKHMQSFTNIFPDYLKNEISIIYVDGFHKVKVSFQGMTSLPQVSFDIDAPDWAKELKSILEKEKRIFSHVTRPLNQPFFPRMNPRFMKSKIAAPLPLMDQLLANKFFGNKQASELFKVRSNK
jgi:hypothetical protein